MSKLANGWLYSVFLIVVFIDVLALQMQTRLSCIRDLEKESRQKKAQAAPQKKSDPEERYDCLSKCDRSLSLQALSDHHLGGFTEEVFQEFAQLCTWNSEFGIFVLRMFAYEVLFSFSLVFASVPMIPRDETEAANWKPQNVPKPPLPSITLPKQAEECPLQERELPSRSDLVTEQFVSDEGVAFYFPKSEANSFTLEPDTISSKTNVANFEETGAAALFKEVVFKVITKHQWRINFYVYMLV